MSYAYLHERIRNKMLTMFPLLCTKCGSTLHVDVANLKGHVYTEDVSDYTFLCRKCHIEYDNRYGNLRQGVDAIINSPSRNPSITTKTCTRCGITKDLSEFYFGASYCKECCREIKRTERAIFGGPILKLRSDIKRGVRVCHNCEIEKPLSEFVKNGNTTRTVCKVCYRVQQNSRNRVDVRCY